MEDMRRGASVALAVCGVFVFAACGQAFTATGDAAPGDAGAGDRAVSDGTSADDVATDTGPEKDATDPMPEATTNDAGADCPDEHGSYQIASTGPGCGADLSDTAPQCITQMGCSITFVSMPSGGATTGPSGLNGGPIAVDKGGGFTGATIYEGDGTNGTPRKGCSGVWTKKGSTLVVKCGGIGTQSCIVTLTRTGSSCVTSSLGDP
jgi:hypothetical protein